MNDEIFTGLVAQLEDRFQEMDSGLSTALIETDAEYAALAERRKELEVRFPFIESMLEKLYCKGYLSNRGHLPLLQKAASPSVAV